MDAYIGEIRLFPYTYSPEYWALCAGQQMLVAQYQALYAVIGNRYGGTAGQNFNLPDLRGRTAIGAGTGPGLTPRVLAASLGEATVKQVVETIPAPPPEYRSKPLATARARAAHSGTRARCG